MARHCGSGIATRRRRFHSALALCLFALLPLLVALPLLLLRGSVSLGVQHRRRRHRSLELRLRRLRARRSLRALPALHISEIISSEQRRSGPREKHSWITSPSAPSPPAAVSSSWKAISAYERNLSSVGGAAPAPPFAAAAIRICSYICSSPMPVHKLISAGIVAKTQRKLQQA